MLLLASAKFLRVLLAPALVLWISGTGCLLGCGNMSTVSSSASNVTNVMVAGDACAAAHSHDCCAHERANLKQRKKSQSPEHFALHMNGVSLLMEGCPLAVNATAALSKARPEQHSTQPVASIAPELAAPGAAFDRPFVPLPRLPNRGHTYLSCCAFLI